MYVPIPSRGTTKKIREEYKGIKEDLQYDGRLKIYRYNLMALRKSTLLRALRYFIQNFKQYGKGIKTRNVDLIFTDSTPPTQGAVCALIKKKLSKKQKKQVPFVYKLQDIFPDSLVNAGMAKKGSLLYKIGRKIENYTYKNADKIIVISDGMKTNLMQKGVPEDKVAVIPNWIDTDEIKPVSRENNRLFDEYNISRNKCVVLYAGNFGASQGTDVILDAAKMLEGEKAIQFVLFGGGSEFEKAKSAVTEKGLTNVIINPLLPPERISEVYSMGDIALITCKKGVGQAAMPSKTYSIMACNTPIIAAFDTDSDLADLLKKSGCGICVEPENAEALATEIKNKYDEWSSNINNKCDSRNYVKNSLSKDICVSKYLSVIEELIDA